MKLSEAVRLSTTIMPAIHGPVFRRDFAGKVCGACRIGATAIAAGYKPPRLSTRYEDSRDVMAFFDRMWPWGMKIRMTDFTFGPAVFIAYCHEIEHLTADQIADKIERFEKVYANPATMDVAPNVAGDATQLMEVL